MAPSATETVAQTQTVEPTLKLHSTVGGGGNYKSFESRSYDKKAELEGKEGFTAAKVSIH